MKLVSMLNDVECQVIGSLEEDIRGIAYDSRMVKEGYLFFALPGYHVDGKAFILDAVKSGAKAIVSNEYVECGSRAFVVVPDVMAALSGISTCYYHHPDRQLLVAGVTGTNGKTTITYFLESIFNSVGIPAGVVGTINYRYAGITLPSVNTTPQSADLQRILHDMVKNKQKAAVMEVSSHALALGRVNDIEFDIGIFTNLTRDHLDFHNTMEGYFEAKKKLFMMLKHGKKGFSKYAIINTDDPWGRELAKMQIEATIVTYGFAENAAVRPKNVRSTSRGSEFMIVTPSGQKKISLPHIGTHNIYNALAAAAASISCGISLDATVCGIENTPMVPGRLEKIDEGQPFTVVVDYAHTDDALKNVLSAIRQLKPLRIITIFGCGGDRDRSKRPIMGEVAGELSDYVFITSDNPRSEDPEKIALDIEVGLRRRNMNNYQVLLDREHAIAAAVEMAQKGDVILVAGKGHETYQIIGSKSIHFNDGEIVRKYLKELKLKS